MSLQHMMYNGISGLNCISGAMSVVSNNVANMNSTGHKSSSVTFRDLLPSTFPVGEVGNGASVAYVTTDFTNGAIEQSSVDTDMAIHGKGFFMLRDAEHANAEMMYSRDGQFQLRDLAGTGDVDAVYDLVNSNGYRVQGINLGSTGKLDRVVENSTERGADTLEDVLIRREVLPKATERVSIAANIQDDPAKAEAIDEPLYSRWNGSASPPLAEGDYDYSTEIFAYDDQGTRFPLTLYFDHTSERDTKEFLLTCNPADDARLVPDTDTRFNQSNLAGSGSLMYGKLFFDNGGNLTEVQCWQPAADGSVDPTEANRIQMGRGEGFPQFSYNISGSDENLSAALDFGFTPTSQRSTAPGTARGNDLGQDAPILSSKALWAEAFDSKGNQVKDGDTFTFTGFNGNGDPVSLEYTVSGTRPVEHMLSQLEDAFDCVAVLNNGQLELRDTEIGESQLAVTSVSYRDAAGNDPAANPGIATPFGDNGAAFSVQPGDRHTPSSLATTSYASESYTLHREQDGYGKGYLEKVNIDRDGVISGVYSNGQTVQQAQLMLADFINYRGLSLGEGNTFHASADAGQRIIGTPGGFDGSLGSVFGNSLEASNVDLGRELVALIVHQRVFQSNSVSISTADEIYQTVLRMK